MSISNLEKLEIKEIVKKSAKSVIAYLVNEGKIKRWVPRKVYAKYYGFSIQFIHHRTKFLLKKKGS